MRSPAAAVRTPVVLLVDDRPEGLLALRAVLEGLDADLVCAASGEQALRVLLRREVAVVLLDVQMPGIDGFETATLIRGRERSRHTPIIFLTALQRTAEHAARGYGTGAVDYVVKPFEPVALRSKVAVFCALQRERDARLRADELLGVLQRELLPDALPRVDGLELSAYLTAGEEGSEVGGDWYDALELPGGRLGLVVGDVAGHGVAAAARMGELRAATRAYALEGDPPAEVVHRLHRYAAALETDGMTTVLYAVVERAGERVALASAGHLPVLLAPGGGAACTLLDAPGPPLGAPGGAASEQREATLGRGGLLALVTDGLVERRGEPLDAGLERLRRALDDPAARTSAPAARDALLAAGLPGGGGDDVTALVARAA